MASQSSSKQPTGGRGDTARVAIPRLQKSAYSRDSGISSDKNRVAVACTNCRTRKVKCTGELPRCGECVTLGVECEYISPRKDRLKIATEYNLELVRLLEDLSLRVDGEDEKRINDLVAQIRPDISTTAASFGLVSPTSPQGTTPGQGSAGWDEDIDVLDHSITRNQKPSAVGFLGGTSAVQWLKVLRDDLAKAAKGLPSGAHGPSAPNPDSIDPSFDPDLPQSMGGVEESEVANDSTFYLDGEVLEVDFSVVGIELPSHEHAQVLISSYMRMAQTSFPIVPQKWFEAEVERYFADVQANRTTNRSPNWLTMLNLVFAVGAKFAYLIGDSRVDEHDHARYFSRAHLLHLHVAALAQHSDIFTVRNTAILALYFFCKGHINRAWISIGVSVRCAQSLGLHVRTESSDGSVVEDEPLTRTWWAIYCLERILSIHTGRPSMIVDSSCSVNLPLPLSEDQWIQDGSADHISQRHPRRYLTATSTVPATSAEQIGDQNPDMFESGLEAAIKMSSITQSVLEELYSVNPAASYWKDNRRTISSLMAQLNKWVKGLPPKLGFRGQESDPESHMERTTLGFQYYSAKISITVPCLRRINQRLENQTTASNAFDIRTAQMCVNAAKSITNLLPDEPAPKYMYWTGPTWSIVHFIMEALAVFLSEMAYDYVRVALEQEHLGPYVKKLMRWLHEMSLRNPVAEKALRVAWVHLNAVVRAGKAQLSDLVEERTATAFQRPPFTDPLLFGRQGSGMDFAQQEMHQVGQQSLVQPGSYLQEARMQDMASPDASNPTSIHSPFQFPQHQQGMNPGYDPQYMGPYGEDTMFPAMPAPAPPRDEEDFNMLPEEQ